jgi:hypothetical protein
MIFVFFLNLIQNFINRGRRGRRGRGSGPLGDELHLREVRRPGQAKGAGGSGRTPGGGVGGLKSIMNLVA